MMTFMKYFLCFITTSVWIVIIKSPIDNNETSICQTSEQTIIFHLKNTRKKSEKSFKRKAKAIT